MLLLTQRKSGTQKTHLLNYDAPKTSMNNACIVADIHIFTLRAKGLVIGIEYHNLNMIVTLSHVLALTNLTVYESG